mgnify:CR=1 FL=1
MIVGIKVSGFDEVEKMSLMEEKRGLVEVSNLIFNKVVNGERDNVLMRLMGKFKSLRFEDLEEIYDDGCLVLWDRMMDKDFKLKEKNMVGYLVRVCKNIGMHYLSKVNVCDNGIEDIFEVMEEKGDEVYEKLDKVWDRLKEVDKMILESYYVDGCKMEEIAKRIGYRNGNSVKSKKNKVLKKMMEMMNEGADSVSLPLAV